MVTRISRLGIVNAYLVSEDDGLTLIDTGLPGTHRRILAVAGTPGAPIVRIARTPTTPARSTRSPRRHRGSR